MHCCQKRRYLSRHAFSVLLVLLCCCLLLSACGKEKQDEEPEAESAPHVLQAEEIRITGANFYDYFDYREYPSFVTDEDGNINACNLSYGFSLRDGLVAANDPKHKDTLSVSFQAEGISQYGEFDVNYMTLQYTGSAVSEERETVAETLSFWPQGNRTISYPYGTLSSSYIIRLYNFTVTSVSGSIWLLR